VLNDLGAKKVLVVSRNGEINYKTIYDYTDVSLIVNASPVGMYPNNGECLIDLEKFPLLEGVADMVYNPSVTELIYRAKSRGIKCVNGLIMLVAQAKRACELFTDKIIPDSVIKKITKQIALSTLNIALIGMPGSGKTTIGKILSQKLNRTFIDSDKAFLDEYKVTAGECIESEGESAFREKEGEIIKTLSKNSGTVIATGGGVVTREGNVKNLRQNSIVVYVKRAIKTLSTNGRPLSKGKTAIKDLYKKRKALYQSACDFAVLNDSDLGVVSDRIIKKIKDVKL